MTPAMVPEAYPPRPLVTSHSRRGGGSSPAVESCGWAIVRVTSAIFIVVFLSVVVDVTGLGAQQDRCLARDVHVGMRSDRRRAAASVLRRFAAPLHGPARAGRRR